jgi:hypothetical protein
VAFDVFRHMKLIYIVLFSFSVNLLSFGQIDTADFIGAEYPTGTSGFYRDIEAFSSVTLADKEYLSKSPADIYMEISVIGTIMLAEIHSGIDTNLQERILKGLYRLHDFTPASYRGEPIESILRISFTYEKAPPANPDIWRPSKNKMVIEIGGFLGGFAGNIQDKFGINGGMSFGWGVNMDNTILNLEVAFIASQKQQDFYSPPEVVRESNHAIGLLGIGLGKEYRKESGCSLRVKSTVHYGFLNVGFKSDDSLYRLQGISPGIELGYHIPLSRLKPNVQFHTSNLVQHGLLVYGGLQRLYFDGEEADGWFYGLGVKYFLSTYGIEKIAY